MVKNKQGGNQGKKIARKNNITNHKNTIVSQNEDEIYGIIIKILGGNQFHVKCNNDEIKLCIIRKKFTGKNKHNNFIKLGTWVLIGLRSWETKKHDKMEKCDLIECYNENDKNYLQSHYDVDILLKEEKKIEGFMEVDDDVLFEENDPEDEEETININDI